MDRIENSIRRRDEVVDLCLLFFHLRRWRTHVGKVG